VVADVAAEHRKAALQSVLALLPDENREALQCLLLFLSRLADYADENQVQRVHVLSSLSSVACTSSFRQQQARLHIRK